MPDSNHLSFADISILYVEDEAVTREQVSCILVARGYRLTVAENGEQGLDLFRKLSPDIVLTDIMMPRLNGLDMAREIRTLSQEAQIVCMTAFSDTSYLIDAIDIGINQYVLKPVEFKRLFTALDRCQEMVELRKRQERLEVEHQHSKKIEAIGILAGGMAHDFNNLLQVILGYASLARMSAEPGSKTEALLAIVEKTSETAQELSSRLLTFARGGDAVMNPTQPGQFIRKCIESKLNSTSDITLSLDLPDDLPLVMFDADQIQQLIVNVVSNASEAMPNGGLLHVSASTLLMHVVNDLGLSPGEYLHVSIEDTGIGIQPENLSKVFDPYFSTKEMGCQKGIGLGLALCYSIINHHHGHIQAISRPGVGTGIHIYLPVYRST